MDSRNLIGRFIDYAVASSSCGATRAYMISVAKSEKAMRDGFLQLRARAMETDGAARAYETLRNVNGFYRTRYSLLKLHEMAELAFDSVGLRGWWVNEPSDLLLSSDSERDVIADFIPRTLERISSAGLHHPYSLLTKWMHFCFPESFVIYDWQVALSVQAWGYFRFSLEDKAFDRFSTGSTARPGGAGYGSLLDFYRSCWHAARSEQRAALKNAAEELGRIIDSHVSVIDVIDKALWTASGDPRKMGLLSLQDTGG